LVSDIILSLFLNVEWAQNATIRSWIDIIVNLALKAKLSNSSSKLKKSPQINVTLMYNREKRRGHRNQKC